jgi:phosphate transport system protein
MNEHIVKSFTEQLESLANCVAQMGGLVEAQFGSAIEAMAKRDMQQAEIAISTDERVDELQRSVEDQALKVLALRQPMAVDLRTTLAAIRIASELERIGDYAKNIGKRSLVLNREPRRSASRRPLREWAGRR